MRSPAEPRSSRNLAEEDAKASGKRDPPNLLDAEPVPLNIKRAVVGPHRIDAGIFERGGNDENEARSIPQHGSIG